jgi:heme/copper-type cytochrome/quinol oxidase subunit 2
MQPYIVMACVAFMIVGAVIAVVGRTMRKIERARLWSGENPPQWGGWVMLVGAAFFVPAAILLVVIVKYF